MEIRFVLLVLVFGTEVLAKSHYGNEFYIGMIQSLYGIQEIQIDIASQHEGSMIIDIPFLQRHEVMKINKGLSTVHVNGSIVQSGNYSDVRGIYLKTSIDVAAFVTGVDSNKDYSIRDTYLAIPYSSLGRKYKIASYIPNTSGERFQSEYILISTMQNTVLNFTTDSYISTRHLNISEVQQFSSRIDLSNTLLSSNAKISVISGCPCAGVPLVGISNCDFLVEQMIPSEFWTNVYIVPALLPKKEFVIKFLFFDDSDSNVCITNATRQSCEHFRDLETRELIFGTEPVIVSSPSTFAVVQYGVGLNLDQIEGDPFMMLIPGIRNFLNSYWFAVPNIDPVGTAYLCIIIATVNENGLKLDGLSINSTYERQSVPSPLNNYTILKVIITPGYHELMHENKHVLFGAVVYGLQQQVGWGFPVGFGFEISPTDITEVPNTCFNCEEMSSPEVCEAVRRCTIDEVCYTQRYRSNSGIYFQSGCINSSLCHPNTRDISSTNCIECCNNDFCNNKGCGVNAFPNRTERGPMCYDCMHVSNDSLSCNKVALCSPDEVCRIEKFKWGAGFYYKMGCTQKWCSPLRRSLAANRLKRSLPVCTSCCAEDFCNHNCTDTTDVGSGPPIIG